MLDKLQLMAIMFLSRKDEKGATATEYALLVALIAFIIVAGITLFGQRLNQFFTDIANTVSSW